MAMGASVPMPMTTSVGLATADAAAIARLAACGRSTACACCATDASVVMALPVRRTFVGSLDQSSLKFFCSQVQGCLAMDRQTDYGALREGQEAILTRRDTEP